MTEQRTRLQAITAKLAHLSDSQVTLREELEYNDTIDLQHSQRPKSAE